MPIAHNDPRRVHIDGPLDAKIVILGEAPGREEAERGRPFIGWSGHKLFDKILPHAGIKREDVLVGNVCPIRPPSNKIHQLYSIGADIEEEIIECRKWLFAHPRQLVIALGNTALRLFTGKKTGIEQYRGSLFPQERTEESCDVYYMIHPAAIALNWQLDSICKVDAKKLKRYIDNPTYDTEPRDLYLYRKHLRVSLRTRQEINTPHSCEYFLNFLQDAKSHPVIAFDIETYNETITVFGLATSPTRAISIPFTGQFSEYEEATLIEAVRDLLETPIPKITQNGIYDATYLADQWGISIRGMVWDTMSMHHCIYAELPHSLAFQTSVYTDEPYFKQMAKEASDANYNLIHWEYNALDVACTYQMWERLKGELTFYKLWDFYWSHYVPLTQTLANVQRRGILLDKAARQDLRTKLEAELADERAKMFDIVGSEFNVNSNKQMQEYVHGTLNLPKQVDKSSGRPSLGETQLRTLNRKFPSHKLFFDTVLVIREKAKLISTYLKPMEDPDGRTRTSYNIAGSATSDSSAGGTKTGRLSSSTNAYRRGGNLQNQPKTLRSIYIPDPGWVFWQADMASAESYVVAWDSGEESMLDVLTDHRLYKAGGPDKIMYHELIGSIVTGLEPSSVVEDIRDLAKRVGHAWNYGMAPRKLVVLVNNFMPTMPFTLNNAQQCYMSLNNTLYAVVQWRTEIRRKIMAKRTLTNCWGRQYRFFGRLDDNTFRLGYSFVPQSTVGDALNKCLIDLEAETCAKNDVQVLGQVHDSVFGQCLPEALPYVRELVTTIFERELPMECKGMQLRIPCEFKSGSNWKECG